MASDHSIISARGADGEPYEVASDTVFLSGITDLRYRLQQGEIYVVSTIFTVAASATDGFLVVTGDVPLHIGFEVNSDAQGRARIFEGVTTSDDGTLETSFNKNRNIANSVESEFYTDPTVTDNGTRIVVAKFVTKSNQLGEAVGEWIFLPNTKYLLLVTDESGAENRVNVIVKFFEGA